MTAADIVRLGNQFKSDHRCRGLRLDPVFLDRVWSTVGASDYARHIKCEACGAEWQGTTEED